MKIMIRVAICEDNPKHQKNILNYLQHYEELYGVKFHTTVYQDGIDLVSESTSQFDILFLDIEMKIMDGMEAAQKIRCRDHQVIIIFITNLPQYAIQGYDVDAKGFLLKPVKYIAFEQQLQKCIHDVGKNQMEYLSVKYAGGMKKYALSEIYYLESNGHYIDIHTESGTESFLSSIKEMEEKLEGKAFFRCNNGTIVNLQYVESVQKNDIVMKDERLAISRSRKKEFMEALTNYIGGMDV
jgi:DNA-binding LytR/AlgR family response regulator